jgi:branched-chain amino acid transport system substrate-binding protein
VRGAALLALLVLAAAFPAAASGHNLTVYSSLPLSGRYADTTRAVVRGIELALERAGNPVHYVSLNDASPRAANWLPELVARNARRAAQDGGAVAYIGEFNSGATAISMPILNEAGLLQVSPSNTAVGLTRDGPMSEPGEPDKYRPTGEPNFGRVIPNDRVQAAAAAVMLRDAGARRVLFIHDGEVYGRGLSRLVRQFARRRGLAIAGSRALSHMRDNSRALAALARRRRADAVFFGGVGYGEAVPLWRALARVRRLKLFGGDGIAFPEFLRKAGRAAARRTRMTALPMAPDAYPAAGQEVLAALGAGADPFALYGYEAMSVILDALPRGGGRREGVRAAFFATRDRDSVLGRYSIDANGDASLTRYGVYRGGRGRLVWDHAVDAAAP